MRANGNARCASAAAAEKLDYCCRGSGIEVVQLGDTIVIRGFGTQAGTLCSAIDDWQSVADEAKRQGMAASGLGDSYLSYDRNLFIDTLNDWGWCGQGDAPPWYSGHPWSG